MDRIILAFASEKAHAQITRILGSGGLAPSISCLLYTSDAADE